MDLSIAFTLAVSVLGAGFSVWCASGAMRHARQAEEAADRAAAARREVQRLHDRVRDL